MIDQTFFNDSRAAFALDYDDDWVGRYRVQDADLVGVSVMPSIAYQVNEKLSLGAGINGMYGMFDQKVAINNAVPSLSDGRLEIDDDTWGWGGNVGVLYEPTPGTRCMASSTMCPTVSER